MLHEGFVQAEIPRKSLTNNLYYGKSNLGLNIKRIKN
jgi:hypothetical protein